MATKIKFLLLIILLVNTTIFASDYLLQPADTLDIQLLNNPKYNTKQTIAPDGTISLPFLGRVKAQDKTLTQLDTYLKTEFAKYLEQPQIVVSISPKSKVLSPESKDLKEKSTSDSGPRTSDLIMLVIHDLKKDTTEVKSVKSVQEAKAWMVAGAKYEILVRSPESEVRSQKDKEIISSDVRRQDQNRTPTSDVGLRTSDVQLGDIVKIEIGQPEPDPYYVVFYDVGKNTYDLKKATTLQEVRALIAGARYEILVRSPESEVRSQDQNQLTSDIGPRTLDVIKPGDTVKVEIGRRPDFLEENWYKLLSGAGLVLGIFNSLKN